MMMMMKSFSSLTGVLFFLTSAFVPYQVESFTTATTRSSFTTTSSPVTLYQKASQHHHHHHHDEDSAERASPLNLSASDWQRLTRLQTCRVQMPILIVGEAVLPKQQLTFESHDAKFHKLFDYCLESGCKLGILGLNPHTGRPLNRGVTVDLAASPAVVNPITQSVRVAVTGQERFEVQGEPWLDEETQSFYMAQVEMVEDRYEHLTAQQQADAETLAETLPALMQEWTRWVIKAKKTDKQELQRQLKAVGPDMPVDLTQRALWVAAMLNPVPALGDQVCLEIRPAMLAASNDYDRTVLAVQAVQSSIDHLSGEHRLF